MPNILAVIILFSVFFNVPISNATTPAPQNFVRSDGATSTPNTTKSITQYGITWIFATPVQYGQFVNGDYWVVDPGGGVNITSISPGDTIREGTTEHMNGSMINPQHVSQHGYDGASGGYNADLNVGKNISAQTPLVLTGNASLVSTISNLLPFVNHLSYVKAASVLTCLSAAPPSGSFRPGISAITKTLHNESSINHSLLKNLSCPIAKPNIAAYAGYFRMVWLTHNQDYQGREQHPSDGIPENYYYTPYMSTAGLMLHLDYTEEEKHDLLINFIQLGIDIYSFIEGGAHGWVPNGGHASGRKWPILFAGIILDYAPMKNIGQKSGDYLYSNGHGQGNWPSDYISFGEDGQTFYVAQSDVNITNGASWNPDTRSAPNYPYTTAMIGMPEWGIRYSTEPSRSDSSWNAMYRTIGSGPPAWAGTVLAARIMGAKPLWNHNAHFDYVDRYMAITGGKKDPFGYTVASEKIGGRPVGIIGTMWDTYRSKY